MLLPITTAHFAAEVLKSELPVLIDFYADWCIPCRILRPIMEEIALETQGIKVGKVNVDEEPSLAEAFHIISIPTLALMKGGRLLYMDGGLKRKEEINAILARWVD